MAERLAKKLLLIGWDAADWKLITPLLDRGFMPTLERLVERGVMGNLATLHPILSPLLWNSIATGHRPHRHGILGFLEVDPQSGGVRPVSSTSRKVKAVWNILSQQGLRSHVIGWFAGHPAEPIEGVYVSPLYAHATTAPGEPWPLREGTVHPARLVDTLGELRVHPAELPPETLLPFVPRADEVDQTQDRHLAMLARALAQASSIHNAATWALEHEPWDFAAIYFNAIDNISHHFMRFHPPRMEDVHPRQFELYRGVIDATYWFHDLLLARLLEVAGPDVTVMLVSDHGFHSDHLRPRGGLRSPSGPEDWHRDLGIVCLAGPHMRRDERIYGASLLDVTPTILTLFGLPVGEDMAGRAWVEALEEPVQPERIPSWEAVAGPCGMHSADQRVDPEAAEAVLQQFVALGYVEPPTGDQAQARDRVVRALRYNLARSHLDARRPAEAVPILEELARDRPGAPVANTLVTCYLRLGRHREARRMVERLIEAGAGGPWTDWWLGLIEYQEGNVDAALVYLRRAEAGDTGRPGLHVRIGRLYLRKGRLDDARRAFARALELDPEHAASRLGLALVELRSRRHVEAAEHALAAVGLRHLMPSAHYTLGVALARLGQTDRAIMAFETALRMEPRLLGAHRWLRLLHLRRGDAARAARHEVAAEEMRRRRRERASSSASTGAA